MKPTIRVLIADDQMLLREGVAALLNLFPDLEIVGKAAGGHEAVAMAELHQPDVVLMDVRMPDMNGIAATHKIRERFPHIRLIILTTFDNDEYVYEALRSGAAGYLLKNADPERLAAAIRSVYAGQSILDPSVTNNVIRRMVHLSDTESWEPILTERLTDREREVVTMMAVGASNAEIAAQLTLAEGTVKNHVSQIIAKLNARDRAHAVRLAVEWGLLCDSV